jgi:acetyltransferase-like isoleucine patch superfamily enzyme
MTNRYTLGTENHAGKRINATEGSEKIMLVTEMLDLIKNMITQLPMVRSARNDQLRTEIATRVAGQILTDDERATFLGLPEGCRIREGAKILSPENLTLGKRCWIGENAVLDASGGLAIGDDCSIGLSVFIWSHTSHLTNLGRDNQSNSSLIKRNSTSIGSGVFIAGPSVVLSGTTIGDDVVVRPFSTVSGVVESGSLVEGLTVTPNVFTPERVKRMIEKHLGESEVK